MRNRKRLLFFLYPFLTVTLPDANEGNGEVPADGAEGLPVGAVVGIAVGGVTVVGVSVFSLIWFVIKKKKWAELLAVFKK